jgi:ABC-type branched-subunit amino acid transport system ATPase component
MTPDQVFAAGLVQDQEGYQFFDRMTVEDNILTGSYRREDKAAI